MKLNLTVNTHSPLLKHALNDLLQCSVSFLGWKERLLLVAQLPRVYDNESVTEYHGRVTAVFQWLSKYIYIKTPMLTALNLQHLYCVLSLPAAQKL